MYVSNPGPTETNFITTTEISIGSDSLPLTEIIYIEAESAEQDQTARMCRLILLYTFRKIIQWSPTERRDKR